MENFPVGRSNKKQYISNAKNSDARKKANKIERRQVKEILNDGQFEGLLKEKKLRNHSAKWED